MRLLRTSAVALVTLGLSLGPSPEARAADLHDHLRNALARGQTEATKQLGFPFGKEPVRDTPTRAGLLVGLDVAVTTDGEMMVVTGVRAVYLGKSGEFSGRELGLMRAAPPRPAPGKPAPGKALVPRVTRLRAPAGHAVAALTLRAGLKPHGMSLTFQKITPHGLDPAHAVESAWVGSKKDGWDATVNADAPVVGLEGTLKDAALLALGLIRVKPEALPAPPEPEALPPAPEPQPPARPAVVKPAPLLPADDRRPEDFAAKPITHRDGRHHFSVEVPAGWRRLPGRDLDRVNDLAKQMARGKNISYEDGFIPSDASLSTFPYVLIQVLPVQTAGKSYEGLERDLGVSLDKPLRELKGSLGPMLNDIEVDRPYLDRPRNRVVMRMHLQTPQGGVASLNVSHLGSTGVVSLHAYERSDKFDQRLGTFLRMNDTFAFDEGHAFTPAEPGPDLTSWLLPVGAFAGVTGVGLLLTMTLLNRAAAPKKRPAPRAGTALPVARLAPDDEKEVLDAEPAPPTALAPSTGVMTSLPAARPPEPARQAGLPQESFELFLEERVAELDRPEFLDVKRESATRGAQPYRIYLLPEELLLLEAGPGDGQDWLESSRNVGAGLAGFLGEAVGEAAGTLVSGEIKERTRVRQAQLDRADRAELIRLAEEGGANVRLSPDDLTEARIEASNTWSAMRSWAAPGWLTLRLRGGKELRFWFSSLEVMQRALTTLPPVLGDRLAVKVKLDRKSWTFVTA